MNKDGEKSNLVILDNNSTEYCFISLTKKNGKSNTYDRYFI